MIQNEEKKETVLSVRLQNSYIQTEYCIQSLIVWHRAPSFDLLMGMEQKFDDSGCVDHMSVASTILKNRLYT